ncbi:Vitamin B12-dependent ribonucleotide reductase [Candidatus Desulfarcum epimagneticum]|uniref:Vitamin B12-dependent ribonucleotide reductase n=1 Tax=uncultured Desulfobacteraceae bacterium TaxID=218296 RepID=A0A484HFB8_9BACT|nr:Vitamin B12-dependent ribonucleotide reductase [uncultured Desulfobacteraceae bacterium]
MLKGIKIIAEKDVCFDLNAQGWDDRIFSLALTEENAVDMEQAMAISRHLRERISRMKKDAVTIDAIDEILAEKAREYGCECASSMGVFQSIFSNKEPVIGRNARTVLERRYLKKDGQGELLETPGGMFRRVAAYIASAEKKYGADDARVKEVEDIFYHIMTSFYFLPNSPTLMNAGSTLRQLAACFVLPIDDSMEDIFEGLKNAAIIHKSGGGTGFSFSRLRPKNSCVGTTGGVASGPVSFMKIFNTATEQVKQGGTRRGANMAVLRVDHPDILEFIHCKDENSQLTNFNISVGVTDAFIEALERGADYDLIDPRTGKTTEKLNSAQVYDMLTRQAWKNGDPGVLFLDRMNRFNPTPLLGEIESTNPCGEQPLLPMEACNLGSLNLARFVTRESGNPEVDYKTLGDVVGHAVHFLDNTIDMSEYPLPDITRMVRGNRKIGLGVMGFADMLYQLEVPYDSREALEVAESVMGFIQKTSHGASGDLARERGVFENFGKSVFKGKEGCEYRNAAITTIAPTGTLSIIAGCSSGIEPLFALNFVKTVMDNDELMEVNPYFEKVAREKGFYSHALMRRIAKKASIKDIDEVPEDVRKVFVTAHDVSPEMHIRMQAAFQAHTDNAVSKTVNLPGEATQGDVLNIYKMAWDLGCKGVTIYRDGSRDRQVLSIKEKTGSAVSAKERPEILEGFTRKIKTGLGDLYVTVTEFEGEPFEVFATIGKSGRSTTAKTEAIGRLVSLALRSGVNVEKIVEQLKGIGGEHPVFQNGGLVMSIPDAISRVLKDRYMTHDPAASRPRASVLAGGVCPECGQTISFEEGCMTCHFCGYSKCA